ncbi:DUF1016 N-terminal domain-containing protein [uncultured Methanolobus sp.]|uniref:DUF1016 N-terminal domain-containing protein n=1 Tax=uncultured Methanolobus sp. TaxID=218300 RepID=UPI002AAA6DE7|nr:DUF1016 N-terminal domain-containing protein [uncultured Methanolobus sp.]
MERKVTTQKDNLETQLTPEYKSWIIELKQKFRQAQVKAAVKVNSTLLKFYWELGADIVEKQKDAVWGSAFLKHLSADLMEEFPDVKGFSKRNLERIRSWYLFYSDADEIATQAVSQMEQRSVFQSETFPFSQLFEIPWSHNLIIVSKCSSIEQALFYVHKTVENGWSRAVLTHQIEGQQSFDCFWNLSWLTVTDKQIN